LPPEHVPHFHLEFRGFLIIANWNVAWMGFDGKTTLQEGVWPFQERKIGILAYTHFRTVFNDLDRSPKLSL